MKKGLNEAASEAIKSTNTIFQGWNDAMLKLPAKTKPKKIEVQYVKNNGDLDKGIQDCWDIFVVTDEDRAFIKNILRSPF